MVGRLLDRLAARRARRRERYVGEESVRREAQQARYRAEQDMAEQRARIESNPHGGGGGFIA